MEGIRINKYLSDAGVCSRREADRLLEAGRVMVDGRRAVTGEKVVKGARVEIDGKEIEPEREKILLAFHKPKGIVCTTSKEEKNNIIDYIQYGKRIYPVGRLDKDSEGLILLTNQGELAEELLRGSNNHEKEYMVTVNRRITKEFIRGMSAGVPILDRVTKSCRVVAVDDYTFKIILTQGWNRQIRRMCEYFDYRVRRLIRIRIMDIRLGDLKSGMYRKLTKEEQRKLLEQLFDTSTERTEKNGRKRGEAGADEGTVPKA